VIVATDAALPAAKKRSPRVKVKKKKKKKAAAPKKKADAGPGAR
jgi:hypothetical protein